MGQRGRPRHPEVLTPREQEVLSLIREGYTNEQIAARLGIEFETAKTHVAQIIAKLGVETREEAAVWREGRATWRWIAAIAGASVVAAVVAGIALALSVSQSGDGEDDLQALAASPQPTPSPVGPILGSARFIRELLDAPVPATRDGPQPPTEPSLATSVWVARSDGSDAQEIWVGQRPVWSRTGHRLAFLAKSGQEGVVTVREEDGTLTVIDNGCVPGSNITWSWDDSLLAFCQPLPGGTHYVAARTDGAGTTTITSRGGASLSPTDFRTIVGEIGILESGSGPVVYDLVTGEALTKLESGSSARWSPDGRLIAFVTTGELGQDPILLIADADTGQTLQSMPLPHNDIFVGVTVDRPISWAPDSTRLAIGTGSRIAVADLLTEKFRDLGEGSDPAWSPSGDVIAYGGVIGTDEDVVYNIYTVSPEGGVPVLVTEGLWPAWSADGEFIAFGRVKP